jgi:hypothetical protein
MASSDVHGAAQPRVGHFERRRRVAPVGESTGRARSIGQAKPELEPNHQLRPVISEREPAFADGEIDLFHLHRVGAGVVHPILPRSVNHGEQVYPRAPVAGPSIATLAADALAVRALARVARFAHPLRVNPDRGMMGGSVRCPSARCSGSAASHSRPPGVAWRDDRRARMHDRRHRRHYALVVVNSNRAEFALVPELEVEDWRSG